MLDEVAKPAIERRFAYRLVAADDSAGGLDGDELRLITVLYY
jgi:hypothetical protein